jgi:hypothetical protein
MLVDLQKKSGFRMSSSLYSSPRDSCHSGDPLPSRPKYRTLNTKFPAITPLVYTLGAPLVIVSTSLTAHDPHNPHVLVIIIPASLLLPESLG